MQITEYLVNGQGLGLAFSTATEVISQIIDCDVTSFYTQSKAGQ